MNEGLCRKTWYQDDALDYTPENFILHLAVKEILSERMAKMAGNKREGIIYSRVAADIDRYPHTSRSYVISVSSWFNKGRAIADDIMKMVREMAYGNTVTPKMTKSFISNLQEKGGYRNFGGSNARVMMQTMKNHGMVIDTSTMNLSDIVTPEAVSQYVKDLLEKGHVYVYQEVAKYI